MCANQAPLYRFLLVAGLAFLVPTASHAQESARASPSVFVPAAIDQAEKDAGEWLRRQMVPNDTVPSPDPGRRRLLVSYRVPRSDSAFKYIYSRSFIYDDALGAIALAMLGSYREAEFILNALSHLIRADGSLWFAFNTQNSWPSEADNDGALIRMGSIAWVGYALTYYLGSRASENPAFITSDPLGVEYLRSARSIARFLLANQVSDRSDPRYGLITGGAGSTTITLSGAASRPVEVYTREKVTWVSMEHNIDAWFFLRDLERLGPDTRLAAAAELIRTRLAELWSEKDGQFIQGIREDRNADTVLPLDGASWGTLFLLAQGQERQAKRCLESMRERFSSEKEELHGFRPYGPEPVYKEKAVNRFYFPDTPGRLWKDLPFVWGEGSLGAAVALARGGDPAEGLKVIDSMRALAVDGGLRYASSPVPYLFTDYPSVATTSWFIIAVETLRGGPAADSFLGR
jgi:hypothetical protein